MRRCPFDHVAKKTERRFRRKDGFVLRLDFLENVRLNCPAQIRHHLRPEPPFGRGDIHGHDNRRRTADRHGGGEIRCAQLEAVVKADHILDRIDRHAAFADFSKNTICVAVDTVKSRAVKGGAKTLRALMRAQKMETLVGVLREHEAGEQTRRFLLRFCFGLRAV
jgi:hypothetical protein